MADARITLSADDRATRVLQGLRAEMKSMEGSAAALRGALGGVGAAFAGAFSLTALTGLARATVDGVDKLNDLKAATGASIENLSALEDVAERTGTGIDTVGDALLKFNRIMNDAADPTSTAAAQLKALGLNFAELQRLDPAEAFQRMAIAVRGFADDGNKGRFMVELFGKQTKATAKFMEDLADAGKLVATVTTQQAEAANKFNNELAALAKSATDLARALAGPMVSSINSTIEKFREGARAGKGFFETLREEQMKMLGLGSDVTGLRSQIASIDQALGNAQLPDQYRVGLLEKRIKLTQQLTALLPKLDSAAGAGRGFVNPELVKPSLPDLMGKPPKAPKSGGGSPAKENLIPGPPLDRQEAFRASELAINQAVTEALRIDQLNTAEKQRADALKLVAEEQQRLNEILGATPSGELEAALKDIQLINKAFAEGQIDAQKWAEAMRGVSAKLGDGAKQAASEWSVFADQAARNIQDALGNSIEAVMQGNFKSVGDSWKKMIDRMVAEALAAKLAQSLLGDFGKTGEMGGWIGDLFKFAGTALASAKGNAFVNGRAVSAFASGGILGANGGLLTRPTVFPMRNGGIGIGGEAGIEAVMPLKRGRGGRLGVESQGGGGTVVNQVNSFHFQGAPPDRRSMLQLQAEVGTATQRAIARNS